MSLYEDIVFGLKSKGFEVQYYPDKRIKGDPFNKVGSGNQKLPVEVFMARLDSMWSDILARDPYNCCYDYLFVVDGLSIPPSFFERLRKNNPSIVTCNYLYDRVKGVYELDRNFPFYDRVFSFDKKDSNDFHLLFLPIYWTPMEQDKQIKYDLFGFGAYDRVRLETFRHIRKVASKEQLNAFVKIYNNYSNYFSLVLKNAVKSFFRREHFPLLDIVSGMFTNESFPPSAFKELIASSKVIVDTNHPFQDGLTARFMWALGAEKKIVTTNTSVRDYSFYTKEQCFIIDDNWEELPDFLKSDYSMPDSIRTIISKYRIDNWLDTILE